MRKWLVLGMALVLFLAGARQALAVAGTGPIGAKCGDNNLRYRGSPVTAGLDFDISTCQTQEYCKTHAPSNDKRFFWDPQSPDCSNAQKIPGGCCAYFKQAPPPAAKEGSAIGLFNPISGVSNLYELIKRVISVFLGIVGALAFGAFVYSGVLWMTAGSGSGVKMAKTIMRNAIIGLFIIALSFAITNFIIDALAGRAS